MKVPPKLNTCLPCSKPVMKPVVQSAPPKPSAAQWMVKKAANLVKCLPQMPAWLQPITARFTRAKLMGVRENACGQKEIGFMGWSHDGGVQYDAEKDDFYVGYPTRFSWLVTEGEPSGDPNCADPEPDGVDWGYDVLAELETVSIDDGVNPPTVETLAKGGLVHLQAEMFGWLMAASILPDGRVSKRLICPSLVNQDAPAPKGVKLLAVSDQTNGERQSGVEPKHHAMETLTVDPEFFPEFASGFPASIEVSTETGNSAATLGISKPEARTAPLSAAESGDFMVPTYRVDRDAGGEIIGLQLVLVPVPESMVAE